MYKAIVKSEKCIEVLRKGFQEIIDDERKVTEWAASITNMIGKVNKPTSEQLRPIALTNVSYKLYMSFIGKIIDQHIIHNDEAKHAWAGFTKGSQIEDSLFILQYCIEDSFKQKKALIVMSLDFSKAFDSSKREQIIVALMKYKIHPKIIDTVANIYKQDTTSIKIGDKELKMDITSGIRQGCTGSTIFFKLITYMIIEQIEYIGKGFSNEEVNIGVLFFADDGLLMAHTIEEAQRNLQILLEISREFELEINKEKSKILIYNMKEQPEQIDGIKITDHIKYLGLTLDNKRNYFKTQQGKMIEKAQKLANMTYSVIEKSSNKLMIRKTYWKNVAIPSILYGSSIVNFSDTDIEKLQRIENGVYRQILGAPRYAANCTLRGEVGASLMKRRILTGRISYNMKILSGNNDLLKKILESMNRKQLAWAKVTSKYMDLLGITDKELSKLNKGKLKEITKIWDMRIWKEEVNSRTSLTMHSERKNEIKEEQIYDNRPSSILLYKARTNYLPLNDRNRFTGDSTMCKLCNVTTEDLEHFFLDCPIYNDIRLIMLQRPHIENKHRILSDFLFNEDTIVENKEVLQSLWKMRKQELNNITRNSNNNSN